MFHVSKESVESKKRRRNSMQKIFVIGFVGREPEENTTATGKKVTTFPVAIQGRKGGEKFTIWYKVKCWAPICSSILPHIKKGSCVTVVGELSPPVAYQKKTGNGEIGIDMSIMADSISFTPPSSSREEKNKDPSIIKWEGN